MTNPELRGGSDGSPSVGYRSVIERVSHYDGVSVDYTWSVLVTRLSDGENLRVEFAWRWRARRFVRSSRRLNKAFGLLREVTETETYTLDMERW